MAANRIFNIIGRAIAVWMAVTALMASEHRGSVKSSGTPVPGATVIATLGDKKVTTTTDENGIYTFPNLEDGVWTLHIEMLGFGPLTKEVGVAPDAPSPEWDLKLLSTDELKAALAAAAAPPAAPAPAAATPAAPPVTTATAPETKPTTPAATPATGATPPPAAGAGKPGTVTAANGRGGRGQQNNGQGNNGRPSLTQAVGGFQRLNVNATGDSGGMDTGGADMNADFGASANDALVMNGSVSSGVAMPQQNDWFGGRGGPDGGFGGPGMMGMGGPGGDQVPGMTDPTAAGGRGGRGAGGPGGGPGGGAGGRGGGGGAAGGFGNLNVGGGGGRAGRGGAGGRGGRGGPNANSFGNGRRGARSLYNASLAFTLDNSALDAQSLSQTGQSTVKPAYAKASLTTTIGGPLKIPHLITSNKINFNLSYSLRRNRSASTSPYTLPTASELAGDFSQVVNPRSGLPVLIYDPTTGNPFPNNVIPTNRISSQALGLLKYYPQPNFTSGASRYNYQTSLVGISNQDNINTRLSGSLNAKNQLNGNFSWQRADGQTPNIWLDGGNNWESTNHQNAMNSGVTWTYHFTNRTFSRLSYTFSRNTSTGTPYWANRANLSGLLGISGNDQDPNFWGPPGIGFSGGSSIQGLSDGNTTINRAQTSHIGDSVIWIKGKHNVTGGGDFNRQQSNPITQSNARGSFSFNGQRTAGPDPNTSGFDFADFLLGLPYTSNIAYGNADKYFRNSWFDAYITDQYQISPRLTLSLGIRWDYQAPVYEKYGRLVNMTIGPAFTTAQPVCASTNVLPGATCLPASQVGLGSSLVNDDPREIQPRIGFAWRPFAKASTVVRGGYGTYYNTSVYSAFAQSMSQQYPLSQTLIDSAATLPLTLSNGFIRTTTNSLSNFALDPNFKIGSLYYWQLSVQQNLKAGLVATVTYNANKGTHQAQQFIPNSAPKGGTFSCVVAGVSNPCPSNFYYLTSGGNSNLQQATAQLMRRFRAGFSGNLLYTLTHSIDDATPGGRGGGGSTAQNWLNLDAERANSSLGRRHAFSMNMGYSTGQGTSGGALLHGWKAALIKGWNLNTSLNLSSGAFETPNCTSCILGGTGITGVYRAQYTGLPLYLDNGGLNPAAFVTPSGQYGNAGRNIITGPTTFNMSASAGRTFRIGERRSADLRFDAQNILNHVNFTQYNTNVGTAQYGLLQGNPAMRVFNATLRFRF